jgi:hypothetical protein
VNSLLLPRRARVHLRQTQQKKENALFVRELGRSVWRLWFVSSLILELWHCWALLKVDCTLFYCDFQVKSKDIIKFQQTYTAILKANMDSLKKREKRNKKAKA